MLIFTPRNFHATLIYVLSLILVVLPFSTLPAAAQTPPSERDPNENKLPKSSGVAVLRTTAPPLPNAPSLDEIKRKGDDLELKKPSKPKEKLPNANRCRPGDFVCQDYWKKQGKPSTNIGQFIPREPSSPMNSYANLLAWQPGSRNPLLDTLRSVSDVSTELGFLAPKAAAVTLTMFQSGVTFGDWPTETTQGRNRQGGTDLFSGNYNWGVPIVGLPGRAGHDLGLGLSYNSHLWLKTFASGIMTMNDFNEVIGSPGGGFFVGLPYLRAITHTTRAGLTAYLLVMPSGKAIELIRRGGSGSSLIYESIDGSVLHLVVETSANQYLFFPDGTRLRFQNFFCTEIKDRNGNLITATYDTNTNQLQKITDTLGRDINFTYGPHFDITDITQSRKDENGNLVTVTLERVRKPSAQVNF